jgi:hypothetical protein
MPAKNSEYIDATGVLDLMLDLDRRAPLANG